MRKHGCKEAEGQVADVQTGWKPVSLPASPGHGSSDLPDIFLPHLWEPECGEKSIGPDGNTSSFILSWVSLASYSLPTTAHLLWKWMPGPGPKSRDKRKQSVLSAGSTLVLLNQPKLGTNPALVVRGGLLFWIHNLASFTLSFTGLLQWLSKYIQSTWDRDAFYRVPASFLPPKPRVSP